MLALALATIIPFCSSGYAAGQRHVPPQVKTAIYARDGIPDSQRTQYVIDHRLPLELGGTNAISNLFAQPKAEANRKDREERALHQAVCAGTMTISAAQVQMLRDWPR
jgi:hypothetical protein